MLPLPAPEPPRGQRLLSDSRPFANRNGEQNCLSVEAGGHTRQRVHTVCLSEDFLLGRRFVALAPDPSRLSVAHGRAFMSGQPRIRASANCPSGGLTR